MPSYFVCDPCPKVIGENFLRSVAHQIPPQTFFDVVARGLQDFAQCMLTPDRYVNEKICPDQCLEQHGLTGLSSLHWAVLRGWELTSNNLNAQDSGGNTPLHLAAMKGNATSYEWLINAGADANIKNAFGGTAEEYRKMLIPVTEDLPNLTVAEECQTPNAFFLAEHHLNAQKIAKIWLQSSEKKKETIPPERRLKKLLRKYEEFQKTPPQLSIKSSAREKNCGLFAVEKISPETIIDEFIPPTSE